MIDQLRGLVAFKTVAEVGSFRGAARKLGLSPSVVSHHVTQLEKQIGLALLYRSTRRISLTAPGAELLAASQRMVAAGEDGLDAMRKFRDQPVGRLRVALPAAQQHPLFVRAYLDFCAAYPQVQLSLHYSDSTVDLEGSAFDVALRGGVPPLEDSSYKVRRVGAFGHVIVVAPSYAMGRGAPRRVEDLAQWDWIQFPEIPFRKLFRSAEGVEPDAAPNIAVTVNAFDAARSFLLAGFGFCGAPHVMVSEDIRAGRLIRLLPDWNLAPINMYAVWPANSPPKSLAHVFVDFIADHGSLGD